VLLPAQLPANIKRRGARDEADADGVMVRAKNESNDERPSPAQLHPLPNRLCMRAQTPSSSRSALTAQQSILRVLCALSVTSVVRFVPNPLNHRDHKAHRAHYPQRPTCSSASVGVQLAPPATLNADTAPVQWSLLEVIVAAACVLLALMTPYTQPPPIEASLSTSE
jgi:hypothetical protein